MSKAPCPYCNEQNTYDSYIDDIEESCTRYKLIDKCKKCKKTFIVRNEYQVIQTSMVLALIDDIFLDVDPEQKGESNG